MRILHLADVHLDTAFASRDDELRDRLRHATRLALRSAVDMALDEAVHAVVIAGDLFDSHRLSFESEQFLLVELERLLEAGMTVVYCTGNHDPGTLGGSRRAISWPTGLHLVDGPDPRLIEVQDRDGQPVGTITTAGHATDRESRDLASSFSAPEGGLPRVAVLHAQVEDSGTAANHDRYAPCTLGTLLDAGFDYWALGHIHQREVLSEFPGVCYPGNLQGRSPRETGAKGAVLAEVRRGMPPTIEFRPLAPIRWETLDVRDPAATTPDALVRDMVTRWHETRSRDPWGDAEWLIRVRISGTTPLWEELQNAEDVSWLADELAARVGALDVEVRVGDVFAPVSVEEYESREDVLGEAIRLVRALSSGGDAGPEEILPELGAQLHGPGDESLQDYLARILEGAPEELVSHMRAPSREDAS